MKIQKIMFGALLLLGFTLPLAEALKNLALIVFLLTGVYAVYKKEIMIKWDFLNISILMIPLAILIGSYFAIDPKNTIRGLNSIITMAVMFIFIREMDWHEQRIKAFLSVLFGGFLVALGIGYYNLIYAGKTFLELHSVGHVNHSSIYMLLIFIISFVYATLNWKKMTLFQKVLTVIVIISSIVSVFITGSRATMYTSLGILSLYMFYNIIIIDKRMIFLFLIMGLLIVVLFMFNVDARMIVKFKRGIFSDPARLELIHTFFYAWKDHNWLFGVGVNNSGMIDLSLYGGKIISSMGHAHNTFLTYLVERGIVGLALYLIFMFTVFSVLIKRILIMPKNYLVVMSLLIWIANFIISFANTTFHHENAILMLIIWAIAIRSTQDEKILFYSSK